MKNKNFGRKRQAIYILSNRKSTRIIKTLMDFFFFIKVKIKMVCFSVPSGESSGGFYPFWQGGLIPWLAAFCIFLICGILLFERKKFFLQKNRDPKFSIILIIKEIMVHKKRRKKL